MTDEPQNTQQSTTHDPEIQKIAGEVDNLIKEINATGDKLEKEVTPLLEEVENSPDIPDADPQDTVEEKDLADTEKSLDGTLDDAILELAPKEEDEIE